MPGFIYFIPNAGSATSKDLAALGLAHVFGKGESYEAGVIERGPGGDGGLLVRMSGEDLPALSYQSDKQEWIRAGAWWLGWQKRTLPGPEDLGRDPMLWGHDCILGDERTWVVPALRLIDEGGPVFAKHRYKLAEGGRWKRQPMAEYAALAQHVETLWRYLLQITDDGDEATPEMSEAELIDIACAALAMNYRVGPVEISALGLLTSESLRSVLHAVVNLPAILEASKALREAEKKKDLAGNGAGFDTGDGAEG